MAEIFVNTVLIVTAYSFIWISYALQHVFYAKMTHSHVPMQGSGVRF